MYLSLHNRSAYSFGSALTRPEELVAFAKRNGMAAIALTDLNGLYAAVPFQQMCQHVGIKPIIGTELRLAGDITVTLLAQSIKGFGNLCRLVSQQQLQEEPLTIADVCNQAEEMVCLVEQLSVVSCQSSVCPSPTAFTAPRGAAPGGTDKLVCRCIPTPAGSGGVQPTSNAPFPTLCLAAKDGAPTRLPMSTAHTNEFVCATHAPFAPSAPGGTDKPVCRCVPAEKRHGQTHLRRACPCHPIANRQSPIVNRQSSIVDLREAFGDSVYVELSLHRREDRNGARRAAQVADELGVPVVATCASRCLRRDQMATLRALASIGTLTLLDQPHPDKPDGTWHLRTPAEMKRLFQRRPDALRNTFRIAKQCDFAFDLSRNRFPGFQSPDGRSAMEHLRQLAVAGCKRRYVDEPQQRGIGGKRPTLAEALERLERELAIIDKVHYAEYFLVFHEIVEYCRGQGIASLARGSAADSLICYALGVSHACPFRFDLPFDRFVNPERAKFSKMADIDLDLPWDQRDQVIRWVYDRWGHDRVAMIGSANTFHGRAAVAELGKVFGLPAHEVYRVTKMMPRVRATNLSQAIAASPEARDVPTDEEPFRSILLMAGALEGLPRHWSMHPCGMVVSPEPLTDLVPVQRSPKGHLVAQFEMDAIEDLGFVKIDLLGQAGLSVLRDTVAEIKRTDGIRLNLERDVDYSDETTWEMIATGEARGVHHIESPAMTSLIRQCNVRDIDALTTIVAIIRPGAANQGKKEAYARRYQGFERPEYAHPAVEPVLRGTYGIMVFEEHILQVATEFAGMNLGRADVLRRALNKGDHDLLRELRDEFIACAKKRGRSKEEIAAVWPLLDTFCGFMFNKAHSAEYAVEAFQGAWLKRRWPAHYLAAILSNYRGFYAHSPTLPQILYVLEALRLGIGFLPPCVNCSRERFAVEEEECRVSNEECRKQSEEGEDPDAAAVAVGGARPTAVTPGGTAPGGTDKLVCRCIPSSDVVWAMPTNNIPSVPSALAAAHTNEFVCATRASSALSAVNPFQSAIPHPQSAIPNPQSAIETICNRMIRVPISHINGLSADFVERHLEAREQGSFGSLSDFVRRCRPGEAEAQLLLDSGALDCFNESRPAMFWQLRKLLRKARRATIGEALLWEEAPPAEGALTTKEGSAVGEAPAEEEMPPIELTRPDTRRIAQRELELLGFPVTIDPLTFLGHDEKGNEIDWDRYTPINELHEHIGRRVSVCGLMVADRINRTRATAPAEKPEQNRERGSYESIEGNTARSRAGDLMKFVTLADYTGFVETYLFPDVYSRFGHLTAAHPILAATCLVEPFENRNGFTLRVLHVAPPERKKGDA